MDDTDLIHLRHMLDAARLARSFAEDATRSVLDEDRMLVFALVRAIEIIGEAASRVSGEARSESPRVL